MSINSFGHLFRVTTWGESHGPALGATIDGCPPGVPLEASSLQHWLDKRTEGEPTPFALNKPQVAEAESLLLAAEADLAASAHRERDLVRILAQAIATQDHLVADMVGH